MIDHTHGVANELLMVGNRMHITIHKGGLIALRGVISAHLAEFHGMDLEIGDLDLPICEQRGVNFVCFVSLSPPTHYLWAHISLGIKSL